MTAPRLLPQNVDYTDKDFDSIRLRLFALIRSVFPEWTDDSVANFGNMLVECFAFVGDILVFYQDNQARESRIQTARLRRSLIGLAKLVGYSPAGATAASVDVELLLPAPLAGSVTISRGDRVKTAEVTAPIFYQFLEDVVFAPGETAKTVSVENSEFAEVTVTSTGRANQSFVLPATPYLEGSAVPVFADGTYTEVENFLSSTSTDRHFVATADERDRAALRFGNGVNGAIPNGTGSITYKTGGGKAGRVEGGRLQRLERAYTDSFGSPAPFTVTNPSRSSGGEDRESNAQIAVNAPESLRVLERAVAREDYEIAAQQVPGVARALHVTSNEYSAVPENEGFLFIVPTGGGVPSTLLLEQVAAQFSGPGAPYPKPNTYRLHVQAAPYLTVNVGSVVYLRGGFTRAQVRANIELALLELFQIQTEEGAPNEAINFGYYFQDEDGNPTGRLAWSDLMNAVRDAPGVLRVDPGDQGLTLNGERDDVAISPIQFPIMGTLGLIDGTTGDPL